MHHTMHPLAAVAAALSLVPVLAHAGLILDTGTPPVGATQESLSTSQWFAAEFAIGAGETVTGLSAFLSQGAGQPGDTYTLDIFSASGFTGRLSSGTQVLDYTTTGTFTNNGTGSGAWNTTSADWTAATGGDYWLALEVTSTSQTRGLDLLTTANNGIAPALAFAYYNSSGTNGSFTTAGAPAVGLQVTAVPLPSAIWLLGGGFLGLGACLRRRQVPV
jgi:hypothetical protein